MWVMLGNHLSEPFNCDNKGDRISDLTINFDALWLRRKYLRKDRSVFGYNFREAYHKISM